MVASVEEHMRVLVADDDAAFRCQLTALITRWGYEVRTVEDGLQAWSVLEGEPAPHLAVLDWVMPGLTGVELCRRLKERPGRQAPYTILLSGRSDLDDVLQGLGEGAHDYVVKPFEPAELRSRLAVGARIAAAEAELSRQNGDLGRYATQMEQLASERAQQLVQADRMATLGLMAAGVAHEINNPTSFISGNVQMLREVWPLVDEALRAAIAAGSPERARLEFIKAEAPAMFKGMADGVQRIAKIVKGLRLYARGKAGPQESFALDDAIVDALELTRNALKHHATVEWDRTGPLGVLKGDRQRLVQVVVNLLVNAADALEEVGGGTIWIGPAPAAPGRFAVALADSGRGIPPQVLAELFKPFHTTKPVGKGTGLGLSISKQIVAEHGGELRAENRVEGGARFILDFPATSQEKAA